MEISSTAPVHWRSQTCCGFVHRAWLPYRKSHKLQLIGFASALSNGMYSDNFSTASDQQIEEVIEITTTQSAQKHSFKILIVSTGPCRSDQECSTKMYLGPGTLTLVNLVAGSSTQTQVTSDCTPALKQPVSIHRSLMPNLSLISHFQHQFLLHY